MASKQKKPTKATKNLVYATTPYNFVSLPKNSVPAPFVKKLAQDWQNLSDEEKQEKYAAYVKQEGKHTGFLELTIETISPCFINTTEKPGENYDTGKSFFQIGEDYIIPGSSLRGIVKNIFKIISGGAMRPNEDLEDKHLYFRSAIVKKKEDISDVLPGFLLRTVEGDYFVSPAEVSDEEANDNEEYLNGLKVYWNESNCSADLISGFISNKTNYPRIFAPVFAKEQRLLVPPEVIKDYMEDLQRAEGFNLLDFRQAKRDHEAASFTGQDDVDYLIPCFYTAHPKNKKIVKNFGHCRHYRVPYKYSIGEFVPEQVKNCPVDLGEAVFGNKSLWASRIFFEDAIACGNPSAYDNMPRPLLKPNPTSYQLYLTQGKSNTAAKNHWGKSPQLIPPIRGYKLYWHNRDKDAWKLKDQDKILPGMTKIKPLKEGTVFRGRIRFQDLSDIELGALCAVFHIDADNKNIAYKIGQGKSLGMGSIRINTTLYTEDNDLTYYQILADDNGGWWQEAEKKDTAGFIKTFEDYRDNHLLDKESFYISMQELAALLDFNVTKKPNWSNKIAPMGVGDQRFKDRISLTTALEL